jgi:hypothetical protein
VCQWFCLKALIIESGIDLDFGPNPIKYTRQRIVAATTETLPQLFSNSGLRRQPLYENYLYNLCYFIQRTSSKSIHQTSQSHYSYKLDNGKIMTSGSLAQNSQ